MVTASVGVISTLTKDVLKHLSTISLAVPFIVNFFTELGTAIRSSSEQSACSHTKCVGTDLAHAYLRPLSLLVRYIWNGQFGLIDLGLVGGLPGGPLRHAEDHL